MSVWLCDGSAAATEDQNRLLFVCVNNAFLTVHSYESALFQDSVENLLVIARVRALAHKCYVTEVLVKEKEVKLTMYQKAKINVGGIPDLVNSYGGALKLVPGEVPVFHYVERKPKGITIEDMLFKAEEILKGLRKLRM